MLRSLLWSDVPVFRGHCPEQDPAAFLLLITNVSSGREAPGPSAADASYVECDRDTEYFYCGGNEALGEAAGARLTRDAELGAGPHEAVLVLCNALEHAGVGHTQVRYCQGSVLHLDPVLDGDRKAPRGKARPASGGKRSRWPVFPARTRHEAVGLGMQTSHLRMRRPRWKR